MVHQYSHLVEKLLRLTHDDLGVNMKGTLEVCDGFTIPKAKSHASRNKTYKRATKTVEVILVDTTSPFTESLIGNRYWIGIVNYYSCYYCIFLMMTKSQLLKKMEYVLKNNVTWYSS